MKITTRNSVWKTCCARVMSPESSITVTNMIGAKMSARLSVRCSEGSCGSRPLRGAVRGRRVEVSRTSLGSISFPSSSSQTYSWRSSFARRRRCLRVGMWRLCPRAPGDLAASDHRVDDRPAEVVREVAPVVGGEEDEVGVVTGLDAALPVRPGEDVRGVHGAGGERLRRLEPPELRARERAHEREALAERAARVEVRGEGDCS